MKLLAAIIFAATLCSCGPDFEVPPEGITTRDIHGNIYHLKHHGGSLFEVIKIPIGSLEKH